MKLIYKSTNTIIDTT